METYDLVMLGIVVAATLFGAYKGFAWQIASLASLVVSYVAAYKFRDAVTPWVTSSPPWNTFTAMLIIYSAVSAAIWVAFRVVADLIDKMRLENFDRQMGAVFGLAKGGLFCILITFFAVTLLGEDLRRQIVHSRSGHYIAQLLHDADPIMPGEIKDLLGPHLATFDRELEGVGDPPVDSGDDVAGAERGVTSPPPPAAWNNPERRTPRR